MTDKINLGPDDKTISVMIYSLQRLIWGNLIAKKAIRVCTWLQTEMAPNYLDITDAQILLFGAGNVTTIHKSPLLHVQKEQIIAYHLLPPGDESPYFDTDEPHRKMEPVIIFAGIFRFVGSLRMAEQSDLKTYLGVQKGQYLPIFDLSVTCPLLPNLKSLSAPFALVNQANAVFSVKT